MTLHRLKWAVVAAVAVFLAVLEYSRFVLRPVLHSWHGTILLFGVILICMLFFSVAVFKIFERLQDQLWRRNRELLALHAAGLDVSAELAIEAVLQKVVDAARQLMEAQYGALTVYDSEGKIRAFLTSGISKEQHRAIGDPPEGRGLLGAVLNEGEIMRLADLTRHQLAAGFPPGHPPMRSLLAMPILCQGPYRGNLYLTEKRTGPEFSAEDEETLLRFATQSAIAIDNAYLHQQVRDLAAAEERLRIAHEMHDGLAQVLAYVNTKAQAVREFLRIGNTSEAGQQLDQLAGAARDVYGDVREAILGLRFTSAPERDLVETLREYVDNWQDRSGVVAELEVDGVIRLPQAVEVHLVRVVQEALGNVRKHAQASHARVRIEQGDGALTVCVEDDGVGFDPEAPRRGEFPRFGLTTMRERAESVGGTMQLESKPGDGARVVVQFPTEAPKNPLAMEEIKHARPHR